MPPAESARRTRQDVLRDFRTDQIVDAAWDTIGELGYAEASIDRIAERAGIARSTVYVYFGSKEALLDACFRRGRSQLGERIRSAVEAGHGLEGRLASFLCATLGYVDENREFFKAVMALQGMEIFFPRAEGSSTEVASLRAEAAGVIEAILAEAAASGELDAPGLPAALDCLGTLLYGALLRRSNEPDPLPVELEARRLARLFLYGATRPLD